VPDRRVYFGCTRAQSIRLSVAGCKKWAICMQKNIILRKWRELAPSKLHLAEQISRRLISRWTKWVETSEFMKCRRARGWNPGVACVYELSWRGFGACRGLRARRRHHKPAISIYFQCPINNQANLSFILNKQYKLRLQYPLAAIQKTIFLGTARPNCCCRATPRTCQMGGVKLDIVSDTRKSEWGPHLRDHNPLSASITPCASSKLLSSPRLWKPKSDLWLILRIFSTENMLSGDNLIRVSQQTIAFLTLILVRLFVILIFNGYELFDCFWGPKKTGLDFRFNTFNFSCQKNWKTGDEENGSK
jgi:hypothetical protein